MVHYYKDWQNRNLVGFLINSIWNLIKMEIRDEKQDKHIPMKFSLQIHFESWQYELIGHPFGQPFELAVAKLWFSKLIDGNDEWNVDCEDGEDDDSDDECDGSYEFDGNGDDDGGVIAWKLVEGKLVVITFCVDTKIWTECNITISKYCS